MYHRFLTLSYGGEVLIDLRVRTQPEGKTHDESDTHLSYNLVLPLQSVLVLTENLDIVIEESQESQPNSGNDHQDEVDIPHSS